MTRSLSARLPGENLFEQRRLAIEAFMAEPWDTVLSFHAFWVSAPLNLPAKVRDVFHVSMATYYQRLMAIIDLPEAADAYPETVRVLRKRRDAEREWQRRVLTRRAP